MEPLALWPQQEPPSVVSLYEGGTYPRNAQKNVPREESAVLQGWGESETPS